MNEIMIKTLQKSLTYQGKVILTYKIQYPQIRTSYFQYGKERFNRYNEEKAKKLEEYAEGELYQNAKDTYEYNKENNYPIMIYELVSIPTITYQNATILSLYIDTYIFSGGAHGNTTRESQNWDIKTGKKIPLYSLYPQNSYFILDILKQILQEIKRQMEDNETQYFDNYCELVIQTFNPESYYLTPKGIVIFFGQYDIAPYYVGIPTFLIIR